MDDGGLFILAQALEALDRLREAQALIRKQKLVVVDPSGRRRLHPAAQVEKESRLAVLRAWRQLGLDMEPPGQVGRPLGGE